MRRVIGWLFLLVALGLASLTVLVVGARFHAGPIGPIPGGPFAEADSNPAQIDPASVAAMNTIEIEVGQPQPLTRTTWVLVHDGVLYVPAGLAEKKEWPKQAEAAGRLRARIGERVFPMRATHVTDPAAIEALRKAVDEKYGTSAQEGGAMADGTWFFRLDAPASPPAAG